MPDYQETKRGYLIVPRHDFDFRHTSGDIARSPCPSCSDNREHSGDPSVRMNLKTGIGKCFHCGRQFLIKEQMRPYLRQSGPSVSRSYKLPKGDDLNLLVIHSDDVKNYLISRSITDFEMLDRLHVMECVRYVNGYDQKTIAFPSYDGSVMVNVMYRTLSKKFQSETDCEPIPWNVDSVLGEESVFITEGRMDALSLIQCGHPGTVSIHNGANFDIRSFDRFKFSHFDSLKTIYIAGDNDTVGLDMRRRLAAYFGESRCRIVEWMWPSEDDMETAKDANECLMKGGPSAVEYCIDHAEACHIIGEVRAESEFEGLDDLRQNGLPPSETIRLGAFDRHVKFQTSRLYIVTGLPGTGKSTFADFLAVKLLKESGWKCSIFSPEKFPLRLHYMELAEKILGRSLSDRHLSDLEFGQCKDYMNRNIFHISAEGDMGISSILHTATQQVLSYGVKLLLLDPFNYIDLGSESGMTDTQKISRILITIVQFARQMNVCVILVAHPRKPGFDSRGQLIPITMFDIFGSSDFNNKCDVGIVLQREKEDNILLVKVEKMRFDPMLGSSGIVPLHYDSASGRYGNAVYDTSQAKYQKFDIPTDTWLPGLGGEEQELEFDCPF